MNSQPIYSVLGTDAFRQSVMSRKSVIYPLEIEAALIMHHSLCGTHHLCMYSGKTKTNLLYAMERHPQAVHPKYFEKIQKIRTNVKHPLETKPFHAVVS